MVGCKNVQVLEAQPWNTTLVSAELQVVNAPTSTWSQPEMVTNVAASKNSEEGKELKTDLTALLEN